MVCRQYLNIGDTGITVRASLAWITSAMIAGDFFLCGRIIHRNLVQAKSARKRCSPEQLLAEAIRAANFASQVPDKSSTLLAIFVREGCCMSRADCDISEIDEPLSSLERLMSHVGSWVRGAMTRPPGSIVW